MVDAAGKLSHEVKLGRGMVLHVNISVAFLVYDERSILHILVLLSLFVDMENTRSLFERPRTSLTCLASIAKLNAVVFTHEVIVAIRTGRKPTHFTEFLSCCKEACVHSLAANWVLTMPSDGVIIS